MHASVEASRILLGCGTCLRRVIQPIRFIENDVKVDKLREVISDLRSSAERPVSSAHVDDSLNEMDSIRARGFLKHRYNYTPPDDLEQRVKEIAMRHCVTDEFPSLDAKEAVLKEVGETFRHFVPNSRLHKMRNVSEVVAFYSEPVRNITKYAEMARDDRLPANVAIREHPQRFHPNDRQALHGGITAFPGEGGKVFSIRQKRLLRQFQPKREWYEYEDQNFDHEPIDKNMPWDIEVAKKMDRYTYKTFSTKSLNKKK